MPTYAKNKKGLFNYEILETFEAGVVLTGAETKSVKKGSVSMAGGYASIYKGEVFLKNIHISKYEHAGAQPGYEPTRTRKLLLHKREINSLIGKLKQKGLTLVPISLYSSKRRVKVKLALGKGKTLFDKRETIKKRDSDRKSRALMNESY